MRLSVEVALEQIRAGSMVAFEHPRWSDMWHDVSMKQLWDHPDMREVDLDMCRFNLRSGTTGHLHMKPTKVLCNNGVLAQALGKTCARDHDHTPTAGADTRPAGNYTKEFCQAVVHGYREARERNIWDDYIGGEHIAEHGETEDLSGTGEGDNAHEALTVGQGSAEGAEGITFPDHVPRHVARALRRVHQNLKHRPGTTSTSGWCTGAGGEGGPSVAMRDMLSAREAKAEQARAAGEDTGVRPRGRY